MEQLNTQKIVREEYGEIAKGVARSYCGSAQSSVNKCNIAGLHLFGDIEPLNLINHKSEINRPVDSTVVYT